MLFCNLPGHLERGMYSRLTVTKAAATQENSVSKKKIARADIEDEGETDHD
jgi:hypothetical protein